VTNMAIIRWSCVEQESQIVGGPGWMNSDTVDTEAWSEPVPYQKWIHAAWR
jgi:hypothetical protein